MSNFSTDGPNYEAVFRGMKCLHGGNAEDVKIIVRFLRFFQGQEGYEVYLAHYLPMLPADVAAEFKPKEVKKAVVTETTVTEIEAQPSPAVTETVSISTPKKKKGVFAK